jgi:spore maturation protein SpmA
MRSLLVKHDSARKSPRESPKPRSECIFTFRKVAQVRKTSRNAAGDFVLKGMLNYIWLGLILCAVIVGGFTNQIDNVAQEGIKGAREAVEIALKLIGVMALWLGIMRLAEKAGLIQVLARAIRPLMKRLFPDVPPEHPAMGSMMMNMAANILGVGNAATPLGLRAMRDLQRLNPFPGTASNAMCTFLAINTSSIQLVPANQIAMLAAAGSVRPTAIIGTALVATVISTLVGITSVKLLEKVRWFRLPAKPEQVEVATEPDAFAAEPVTMMAEAARPIGILAKGALLLFVAFFGWLFFTMAFSKDRLAPGQARVVLCENGNPGKTMEGAVLSETSSNITLQARDGDTNTIVKQHPASCPKNGDIKGQLRFEMGLAGANTNAAAAPHLDQVQRHSSGAVRSIDTISILAIPFLVAFFPLYAALRRVKVYEEFVEGAKEGFNVAITIIPHIVAMLVAVFMFRSAGCIDAVAHFFRPILDVIHFPTELLPMSIMRPISGGGTTGIFVELIKTFGPDHLITRTAATIIGSTETTLYVLAVYFGSVAIRRTRHAVAAGLLADAAGIVASVIVCRLMFA